jgi:hypothetical protein
VPPAGAAPPWGAVPPGQPGPGHQGPGLRSSRPAWQDAVASGTSRALSKRLRGGAAGAVLAVGILLLALDLLGLAALGLLGAAGLLFASMCAVCVVIPLATGAAFLVLSTLLVLGAGLALWGYLRGGLVRSWLGIVCLAIPLVTVGVVVIDVMTT